MNDHGARVAYLSPYYPTVALPCTPCTWPRVPPVPGPGAEPRKKIFGLYNAFLDKKRIPRRRTAPRSKALVEPCTNVGTRVCEL